MMDLSRLVRGHPLGWALASGVGLGLGYVSLWRGGTDLAAALLVLGYLVLVPVAIWRAYCTPADVQAGSSVVERAGTDEQPAYITATLVAGVVLALYVWSLAPTTAMWDTSEYIAVARVLGIPHPPGNPLFVLIAHTFALLPIPVSYAERVNLLAATTSAMSAGLWCLVTYRSLRGAGLSPTAWHVSAASAAWIGATAFSVWNQSVVNEKVYTVAMFGLALSAWLALRWGDAPLHSRRADVLIVMFAYLCGLGYANHPAGFLPLPAFGLYVLLRAPRTVLRWRLLLAAGGVLLLGVTPFAFEPIRAAHHPAINEGEPTACTNGPKLDCTFSDTTFARLNANIQREQYGGHNVVDRQVPLGAQVGMWWLYFQWQWWRDAFHEHAALQRALSLLFFALGVAGAVAHWRNDRSSFAFVAPLIFTLTPALIFYLNFRYGASQSPELADSVAREVRDRDYFYVWSFATWSIWIGMGLAAVWQFIANAVGAGKVGNTAAPMAWRVSSPVMLLAFIPFVGNIAQAPRRGDTFTREWARDMLRSVEPYGIIITNGDNDSFPLWYAQQVEGVRPDVVVGIASYLGADWYVRQMLRVPVTPYNGDGLPAYAALARTVPTGPLMALSVAEADQIPPAVQLPEPQAFDKGRIHAIVPAGIITRDQLVVLQMIKDAFPARPLYFSIGSYPQALGLGDYIVTQGLAQRLLDTPAKEHTEYASVSGRYVDVERTRQLWAEYRGPQALRDGPRWVDDASLSIPIAYVMTAQLLAGGLAARGDSVAATTMMNETTQLARLLRLSP